MASVLIIEDGTIVSGANSYVSALDVDKYFLDRNESLWTGSDVVKEAAILKATQYIDGKYRDRWKGWKVNFIEQLLEWPRYGVNMAGPHFMASVNKGYGFSYVFPYNAIPQQVKDAVCEAALRALSGDLAEDLQTGIKSKGIGYGAISTVFTSDSGEAIQRYQVIDQILSLLLLGSSEVVRG